MKITRYNLFGQRILYISLNGPLQGSHAKLGIKSLVCEKVHGTLLKLNMVLQQLHSLEQASQFDVDNFRNITLQKRLKHNHVIDSV